MMFLISIIIAAVSVLADQLIKYAVNSSISLNETIKVIPGVVSLTHIRNAGAAWSIMEGKTWFLIVLPVIVICAALVYMYRNRGGSKLMLMALALVLGGGVGNLIDRIRFHEVIDYIKCELFRFPIFNFADICVVVGVILFCIYVFFFEGKSKKAKDTDSAEGEELSDGK